MSANPVTKTGGVYNYDFTTGNNQAYGTNAQKYLGNGVYGMYSGDANADDVVNSEDKTIWETQSGSDGYNSSDFNMDVQVENKDKNDDWFENKDVGSQVPE
jgi:TPP-dependent trihydroxycyclohexane-1,2-dione (THcHDO) dehydratase